MQVKRKKVLINCYDCGKLIERYAPVEGYKRPERVVCVKCNKVRKKGYDVLCKYCKEVFHVPYKERNSKQYCNLKCAFAHRNELSDSSLKPCKRLVNCYDCGKLIEKKVPVGGYKKPEMVACFECKEIRKKGVVLSCKHCEKEFRVSYGERKTRKFCCHKCSELYQVGENNPAFGKVYWTKESHPERARQVSETSKRRKINSGDKNGMKQPEARAKLSKTRKQMFLDNPELREIAADKTRQAWKDGKMDGVKVGRCKWYAFERKNGQIVKVQGTWELAFVKWLEENNMDFLCHRGRIPYNQFGEDHTYYPDFFVFEWDEYVDVKNKYHFSLNEGKIQAVLECNPDLKIRILFKEDLIKLGVKI